MYSLVVSEPGAILTRTFKNRALAMAEVKAEYPGSKPITSSRWLSVWVIRETVVIVQRS